MMHPDAVIGSRHGWFVLVAVVLAAFGAACGDSEPEATEPELHDLAEPYQITPFPIDALLIADAERACRDPQMATVHAGVQLVLVDARGDNRLFMLFAGPGADAECFLHREAEGRFVVDGGGSSTGNVEAAPGPNELIERGGGSQTSLDATGKDVSQSYALGRIGPNVARVEIVLDSGAIVEASVNRGWFAAWWPSDASHVGLRWYDSTGGLLGSTA